MLRSCRVSLAGHVTVAFAVVALLVSIANAQVLPANPGPANNGGSPNWGMFFDLFGNNAQPVLVTSMTTANTGGPGAAFTVEIFVRNGTGLGGPVGSGPGSSSAGWTSLGTAPATQGGTSGGVSLAIDIPDILVNPGQTTGVAVVFTGVGPRYFGTGTPPLGVYSNADLQLTTGDVRSAPFTTTGSFFTSRELVGELRYQVVPEPASLSIIALGAAWALRRRR